MLNFPLTAFLRFKCQGDVNDVALQSGELLAMLLHGYEFVKLAFPPDATIFMTKCDEFLTIEVAA